MSLPHGCFIGINMGLIYNTFMFYDEFDLLDIRLEELSGLVDKFVLVESDRTYTGKPKPLYFCENSERYRKHKDRIVHIISQHTAYHATDAWANEWGQRESIDDYLKTVCLPDDTIILTDADEIVSADVMPIIKMTNLPGRLSMRNYYYWLNCRQKRDWIWPAFCRYKDYESARQLRQGKEDRLILPNAGWHFAYLMSAERIAEKLCAFSHTECDRPEYTNIENIEKCRSEGIDLFGRPGYEFSFTGLSELPKCIRDNPGKYSAHLGDYCVLRTDIINDLISKHHLSRYLEIGVDNAATNFNKINCDYKTGVDPNEDCKYRMTSDDFFESYRGEKFDLIFVDGLHTAEQALRDINNALNLITENGFIVVHDCNPTSEGLQCPVNVRKGLWCGDVWKAWAELRASRPDLGMYVFDVDYGVGVIEKTSQELFTKEIIPTYEFLEENRRELLNLREPCRR